MIRRKADSSSRRHRLGLEKKVGAYACPQHVWRWEHTDTVTGLSDTCIRNASVQLEGRVAAWQLEVLLLAFVL